MSLFPSRISGSSGLLLKKCCSIRSAFNPKDPSLREPLPVKAQADALAVSEWASPPIVVRSGKGSNRSNLHWPLVRHDQRHLTFLQSGGNRHPQLRLGFGKEGCLTSLPVKTREFWKAGSYVRLPISALLEFSDAWTCLFFVNSEPHSNRGFYRSLGRGGGNYSVGAQLFPDRACNQYPLVREVL